MATERGHGGARSGRPKSTEMRTQSGGLSARAWNLRDALAKHWGINKRKAMERALEEAAEREGVQEEKPTS